MQKENGPRDRVFFILKGLFPSLQGESKGSCQEGDEVGLLLTGEGEDLGRLDEGTKMIEGRAVSRPRLHGEKGNGPGKALAVAPDPPQAGDENDLRIEEGREERRLGQAGAEPGRR